MNIFEASENGFEGIEREQLNMFAQVLGVPLGNYKDDTLRKRLLEKLGKAPLVVTDTDGKPLRELATEDIGIEKVDEIFKLDLTGRGPWQGRRRIVQISKPDAYEGIHPQFISWGNQNYWVRYDHQVSVPYPVRNLLENTKVKSYVRGDPPHYKPSWRMVSRFRFGDLRDDPKTAHLPVSQKHQFRVIANRTDNFREFGANEAILRRNLIKMIDRAQSIRNNWRRRFKADLREQDANTIREALLEYVGIEEGLDVAAA